MVKLTPGVVLGGVATTVAVGTIGYVAWFDYQRRHNIEFRRSLLKERRKTEKANELELNKSKIQKSDALKNAVKSMKDESTPQSVEDKEAYFLEQVAMGEALAARGEAFYIPAAISFFKGLQVYPQPQELLMIYQRTQPAEVIALLMEALKLSIELDGSSSSSSSGGRGGAGGNLRNSGGAILEEIDTDSNEGTTASGTGAGNNGTASGSQRSGTGEENSSASSPGAKSFVDVDYPSS